MKFVYSTGGREKYFKAERAGDCVTRAIANATGKDYLEVYNDLKRLENTLKVGKHERKGTVRDGVRNKVIRYYLEKELGWIHHSTMEYQKGVSLHLTEEEIPMGNLIVDLSKHLTNVKDKVIYDTYDCSEKTYYDREYECWVTNKRRAIYNYWTAPSKEDLEAKEQTQQLIKKQKEAIELTKQRIAKIKSKYQPCLDELNSQMKQIQHSIVIMTNRMNKEIAKVKKEDGDEFCNKLLLGTV